MNQTYSKKDLDFVSLGKIYFDCCIFESGTQAYLEEENPSSPSRNRTYDLLITSSNILSLSYRRLVEARPLN